MGGCWHALDSLGIPPGGSSLIKMIMFETDVSARALLRAKTEDQPGWVQLSEEPDSTGAKGSVLALAENNFALLKSILDAHNTVEHVLFAGGSPCQGFSRASSNPKGVGDERSALIWVFHALPRAASEHLGRKASVAVVLENVVMYATEIRDNISRLFGLQPQVTNANIWAACDRDRNFWSSYPSAPAPKFGSNEPELTEVLREGWRPLWELEGSSKRHRFSTFLRPFPPGLPSENVTKFWKFPLHSYTEHGLVYRPDAPADVLNKIRDFVHGTIRMKDPNLRELGSTGNRARAELCRWIHQDGNSKYLRPLDADERDRAMGFPAGASSFPSSYTSSPSGIEFDRCCLTGNAWSPPAAAHILGPLAKHILEKAPLKVTLGLPEFVSREATLELIQPGADLSRLNKGGGKGRR
jgi:site-specific DNA-cytosine methylase